MRRCIVVPKYVIERDIPGAGKLSRQELQAISQKSCGVLGKLGPQIQWVESFVTDDKVYCVVSPRLSPSSAWQREGRRDADQVSSVWGSVTAARSARAARVAASR